MLQVTGREVDAERHGVVVAMSKARGHGLAELADADHHFALIVDAAQVIGHEKRFLIPLEARVGLEEDDGGVCLQ